MVLWTYGEKILNKNSTGAHQDIWISPDNEAIEIWREKCMQTEGTELFIDIGRDIEIWRDVKSRLYTI